MSTDYVTQSRGLREVIFDMTFTYAQWHREQTEETKQKIMDHFQGSRGMFDTIDEVATMFEVYWQGLAEDEVDTHNYYEEVSAAVYRRIAQLTVEAGIVPAPPRVTHYY